MAVYLLCSSPIHGHVAPLLTIAGQLVDLGHDVAVLTGSRFKQDIEKTGAQAKAFGGVADFDDRVFLDELPEMQRLKGLARVAAQGLHLFSNPISDQYRALQDTVAEIDPSAIIYENLFTGILPLLQRDAATRPRLIAIGVVPLMQNSKDAAPFGPGLHPMQGILGQWRNKLLTAFTERIIFADAQKHANKQLVNLGFARMPSLFSDVIASDSDHFLQLCPANFEYPRSDLSPNIQFIGPLLPPSNTSTALPDWWHELETTKLPVVHVTQGTLDNTDLSRLILPTVNALASKEVLVVVATGGRPIQELGDLPDNVRAAEFLPYDKLMPLTRVFVTNAGYGGSQFALSYGVPIVAAGDTEDKKEVSARISWAGVGIDLKSGTPTASSIAYAVDNVLADPSFQTRAKAIAASCEKLDALDSIAAVLEQQP